MGLAIHFRCALAAAALACAASAQAAPADTPYPGEIRLEVDARDVVRGIVRVHEVVPVEAAGPMVLLYPKWLPGDHAPSGRLQGLAGLTITANGARVPWRRDPENMYAFHLDAPAGAAVLDLEFQYLSATDTDQGAIVMTPDALNLEWNSVLLYPSGHFARRIHVSPQLTLPAGFQFGTALTTAERAGDVVHFATIDLETLVDSPVFAGRYFRRIDLDPGGRAPVHLDLVADRPDLLAATEAQIAPHRRLVRQAYALFGSHHFDHYDFLLDLSDRLDSVGLEHHRSSQNNAGADYFTDWDDYVSERDLLPHEFTHSWNGKYRRPFDLWVPSYEVPMRDTLLWVYEGQTEYWGAVLAARSGLWTRQEALEALARTAAVYEARIGRTWRPLQDTTNDPIIADRPPLAWRSWQRSEDYYLEGMLIWLDVDTLIRERTRGRRSLDDFARGFFGGRDGDWAVSTYGFDDIVAALNRVSPYDWSHFLRARLEDVSAHAPLDGLARGGYRLIFNEERSDYAKSLESHLKRADFFFSLGFNVGESDAIEEVRWDGPAFNQGLTVGATLMAVNGEAYDADALRRAITAAKSDHAPIELLIKTGERFRTISIDYHDGLRYPHLARIAGAPDRLNAILAPRR